MIQLKFLYRWFPPLASDQNLAFVRIVPKRDHTHIKTDRGCSINAKIFLFRCMQFIRMNRGMTRNSVSMRLR